MDPDEQEWIRLKREFEELTVYTQSKTLFFFIKKKNRFNTIRFSYPATNGKRA